MSSDKSSLRIAPFITLYSFTHLAVDAACAFLLLGVLELNDFLILSLLLYNATAFVLQAPFGYLIDKILNPKLATIIGIVLIAVSFFFWNVLFAALIIVSIGNALFHVGGGSLVLSLKNKRATFSGLFVAPGGIGLALGTLLSVLPINIDFMLFPITLFILGLTLCFVKTPEFNRTSEKERISNYRILIIILIMLPIAIRSLIGLSLEFPWKENQSLFLILAAALALGKVSGGILADRYGLIKVGVGGLLISTPLLAFFPTIPALGILGAFLFNFTMPVTLIAILNVMPQNKGLSFGLTTVALFIGALPVILSKNEWIKSESMVFVFIFSSAMILFFALYLVDKLKR